MSIDARAQVAILNCLGQVLYLGRTPRTKETIPDFREGCRVTRHPRVFHGFMGCQWTHRIWGVTQKVTQIYLFKLIKI